MPKITDVKIRKIENAIGDLRAVASITFDECFVIHDIKVIESYRTNKIFVAMPNKKIQKTGEYKDICHPIKSELREEITKAVLEKYNELK